MTFPYRYCAWSLAAVSLLLCSASQAETLLERGTYLMKSIVACGNCHTQQTPDGPVPDMELAGGLPIVEPGVFEVLTPNITFDKETGIGGWTDSQVIAAIREGRRPDGSIIGPPMPIGQYRGMSDRDAQAIVAYMRTVKPVKYKVPSSKYMIPLPPSYGPPVGSVSEVPRDDALVYGAYLAGPLGHCKECHTPMNDKGMFDYENKAFAGGFQFHGPWGVSVSANITPHQDGLAEYSDDDIKRAITIGRRPDDSPLMPPMGYGYYSNISDEDLDAIVAYLRSLKPVASE